MKVGVTGASGFIGKLLCQALIARGDNVVILTRRADFHVPGCESVRGDLTEDSSGLDDFVRNLDILYHCAGELTNCQIMYPLHVEGTRNLLLAVQRRISDTGRSVRWIQLSSVGAYGPGDGPANSYREVDEASTPSPVGVYEVTKTISDELVLAAACQDPRLVLSVLRPSNVVGASMTNRSFFQLAAIVRRRLFFYLGRGDAIATYVHVDDVVAALIACGTRDEAKGKLYILSNDCTQRDVIEALADFYAIPKPRLTLPSKPLYWLVSLRSRGIGPLTSARLDALVKRTSYSAEKIQRDLGFRFAMSIPDSIPGLLVEPVGDDK